MPKHGSVWTAVLLLWAVAGCSATSQGARSSPADSVHLRVLAIHDFHGAVEATVPGWSGGREIGGAAALKAVMDSAEARCGCPTIRLDGGDQMQGSLESNMVFGSSVVQAFNHLGLDAAALGNHELDWGVDTLLARQREATYPWLAANVFRVADGTRPPWALPYAVLERGGLRIGVIGYATTQTPRTLRPAVTAPFVFRGGMPPLWDAFDAVQRENPHFVILVAHAAGDCNGDTGCTGELAQLAAELPAGAVHLIIGGHAHTSGEGVVNGIPIVRAGSHGRAVAVVDLVRRPDGTGTFRIARDTVWAEAVSQDPAMLDLLEPFRARADSIGRLPVTELAESLPASDSRLGNLIADALRRAAGADFGLHNPGGVRADLSAGVVTYSDLYRVLPFANHVVSLTLTGDQLLAVVAHAFSLRPYFFSNLIIRYDPAAPPTLRVLSISLTDGTPIQPERSYTLATSDFLADGGDGFAMLSSLPRQGTGLLDIDGVIELLRSLPAPVALPTEPRTVPVRR